MEKIEPGKNKQKNNNIKLIENNEIMIFEVLKWNYIEIKRVEIKFD